MYLDCIPEKPKPVPQCFLLLYASPDFMDLSLKLDMDSPDLTKVKTASVVVLGKE